MIKNPVIEFIDVEKVYAGPPVFQALRSISFSLQENCFASLIGPSGSGKSTLLNIAAGLDNPSQGTVKLNGQDLRRLSSKEKSFLRRKSVGFIFQSFNLFPTLNAVENVEYTCLIRGDDPSIIRKRALETLERVGLANHAHKRPSLLSGGQQQRVAVARALCSKPSIVFADEPTGSLDSQNAIDLIELFRELNREQGVAFLFSTHDPQLIKRVDTCIELKDGMINRFGSRVQVYGFPY